jgi:hypothetical protein
MVGSLVDPQSMFSTGGPSFKAPLASNSSGALASALHSEAMSRMQVLNSRAQMINDEQEENEEEYYEESEQEDEENEFYLFPKLPIELRLKIWKEVTKCERVVEIRFTQNHRRKKFEYVSTLSKHSLL